MKVSEHRPTLARVDLAAISYNIDRVAAHIPEKTKKWAVVKADAYGHGAVAVARQIEAQVDGFCVSNIDEGLELREAGIKKSILILGVAAPNTVDLAIRYQLVYTVASLEWLTQVLKSQADLTGLTVHIKVDSGMGRIGFRFSKEIDQAMASLTQAGAVVEGIFTHFATADEKNPGKFNQQLARFKELLAELAVCPFLVHASNSATTLWHPETIMNAVRLGDMIYGLNPSDCNLELPYDLKPALTLQSELIHVKKIPAGETVGYGATYQAKKEEWIGTVPIGYADGWTRDMQGFSVLVDGKSCPIVGRVSMDQITICLPKAYPLGTKVTLIGPDGKKEITVTDVAKYRGTINYEVVCLLSDRVPRVYNSSLTLQS